MAVARIRPHHVRVVKAGPGGEGERIRQAQSIFAAIADGYDGPAQLFGLWQYRGWHRALAALVAERRPDRVLDMCTGTGAIAEEIAARTRARITAVDVTRAMLEQAWARPGLAGRAVSFLQAAAQAPPFRDGAFDAVVFSYLLRYVDDVPGTVAALGRLVRPGGLLASLEFGVPPHPVARAAWRLYTRGVMRAGLAVLSPGWRRVGGFLGDSISTFYEAHPLPAFEGYVRSAGFEVHPTRRLSLGGGVIISATRLPELAVS